MANNKGMKVVINAGHGGFGLSKEGQELYASKKGIELGEWNKIYEYYENISVHDIDRTDPALVEVVKELGKNSNSRFSSLKVVALPKDVGDNWVIMEYDGLEWVAEKHRTWS